MKLRCTRALAVAQYETLAHYSAINRPRDRNAFRNEKLPKKLRVSNPFSIGLLSMVSAAAMSEVQLEHMSQLLRSVCPGGYRIRIIEYGKMLVMLVYGEYYGRVYKVYKL